MHYKDYERNAYNSKLFAQRYWHRKRIGVTASVLGKAESLLDVGCGSGLLIEHANAKIAVGVDTDKETLKINMKRNFGKKAFFVVADATALPFKASSFDAVSSTEIIEHIGMPEIFAKEMSRVLMQGGKAVVSTPNYASAWPLVEAVWSRQSAARNYTECHVSHFTARKLRKLLEQNGLFVKSSSTMHSLVMLNGIMKSLCGPADYILTRAGFGMVMIFLAKKAANTANASKETNLKNRA